MRGAHLFEKVEVNTHSCVKQQGWQENVEEELIGLNTEPDSNGVTKSAQVQREHEPLEDATCNANPKLETADVSTGQS